MPRQRSKNKNKTASTLPDCVMCNKTATLSCSSCHSRNLYCSESCQSADEKLHKVLCSSRPSFETPPTASSRRAIVFHTNGEIRFTWITTKTVTYYGTIYEFPVGIEKYFVGQYPAIQSCSTGIVRGNRPRDNIALRFNLDSSEMNLAVYKVVEGMDDGGAVWRGPLVAMKETRSWVDRQRWLLNPTPRYGHMNMRDLRVVVDFLTTWKPAMATRNYQTRPHSESQRCSFLFPFLCFCSISWLVWYYLV